MNLLDDRKGGCINWFSSWIWSPGEDSYIGELLVQLLLGQQALDKNISDRDATHRARRCRRQCQTVILISQANRFRWQRSPSELAPMLPGDEPHILEHVSTSPGQPGSRYASRVIRCPCSDDLLKTAGAPRTYRFTKYWSWTSASVLISVTLADSMVASSSIKSNCFGFLHNSG